MGAVLCALLGSMSIGACDGRPAPTRADAGPRCAWRPLDIGLSTNVSAIWGTAPDDVYVSAQEGVVMHYDGSRWSRLTLPAELQRNPNKYTALGPGQGGPLVLNGGVAKREGGRWRVLAGRKTSCRPVGGIETTKGEVFVGCWDADIYRIVAGQWIRSYEGKSFFMAFVELSNGELIAGGTGTVLRLSAEGGWVRVPTDRDDITHPSIWAPNADEFYLLANGLPYGRVYHYRGEEKKLVFDSGLPWGTTALWASSRTDIHIVGRGVWHYDGVSWREIRHHPDTSYSRIWGAGPEDIYAGGGGGMFIHYSCRP